MNISKTIFLFLFTLFIKSFIFGQKIIDSVKICGLPVKEGIIYKHELPLWVCADYHISIITKFDSVYHLEKGIVAGVFCIGCDTEYDGSFSVIIKNNMDEFICYSNIKSTLLKKGEKIERGSLVGLADKSKNKNYHQIDFIFYKKRKRQSFDRQIEYLKCNGLCYQSESYTL